MQGDVKKFIDTAIEQGFRPPLIEYVKDDIRGSEYGHWIVRFADSDNIKVRRYDGQKVHLYTIRFDSVDDFKLWCRDTV